MTPAEMKPNSSSHNDIELFWIEFWYIWFIFYLYKCKDDTWRGNQM